MLLVEVLVLHREGLILHQLDVSAEVRLAPEREDVGRLLCLDLDFELRLWLLIEVLLESHRTQLFLLDPRLRGILDSSGSSEIPLVGLTEGGEAFVSGILGKFERIVVTV